jgi:hypothetical protein
MLRLMGRGEVVRLTPEGAARAGAGKRTIAAANNRSTYLVTLISHNSTKKHRLAHGQPVFYFQ